MLVKPIINFFFTSPFLFLLALLTFFSWLLSSLFKSYCAKFTLPISPTNMFIYSYSSLFLHFPSFSFRISSPFISFLYSLLLFLLSSVRAIIICYSLISFAPSLSYSLIYSSVPEPNNPIQLSHVLLNQFFHFHIHSQ